MKPRVVASGGPGWLVTYFEDGVTRASWAATWEVALHRANRLAWKRGRGRQWAAEAMCEIGRVG